MLLILDPVRKLDSIEQRTRTICGCILCVTCLTQLYQFIYIFLHVYTGVFVSLLSEWFSVLFDATCWSDWPAGVCWKYEAIVGLVELETDDGQTGAWPEGHYPPFINHHHVGGQWVASGPPVTSHHGDHCFSFAGTIVGNKEVEALLPQGLLETATDSSSK